MADLHIARPTDHQGYFSMWKELQAGIPWGDAFDKLLEKVGPEEMEKRSGRTLDYMRKWFKTDLYALMRFGLSHGDRVHANVKCRWLDQPWLFQDIRRFDGYLRTGSLDGKWIYKARTHFKTTSVQGASIQRILIKPSIRIAYYSRIEPMARERAGGIKKELETNLLLQYLWPEILYSKPPGASKWTPRDSGADDWSDGQFSVKRESEGRAAQAMSESTVKCYGINAVGTGGHPEIVILDDCVDDTNAHSASQAVKTARQMSAAIKATDPSDKEHRQTWIVGTEYAGRSAYKILTEEGVITSTWHESAVDFERYGKMQQKEFDRRLQSGEIEGVLLTNEELKGYRGKGPKKWTEFCHQYLCRLDMATKKTFNTGHLQVYRQDPREIAAKANVYILQDPAGYPGLTQERNLCDSAIGVFALCADGYMRWLDGALDLMDSAARCKEIMRLARKWVDLGANLIEARIEEGGTGGDVSFLCELQQRESFLFQVVRISRGGGPGALTKLDRIHDRISPLVEKIALPQRMVRERRGEDQCLVQVLRNAMDDFPAGSDDQFNLLDMIALLAEPVDKSVIVFKGSREPETRPLGPLKWPRQNEWRIPRQRQTVGDGLDGRERTVLGLFGAGNLSANLLGRRQSGTGFEI